MSHKRRLDSLETAIRPRSPYDGLSNDERAVLCIAKVQRFLCAIEERARNGELGPPPDEPPENAAHREWMRSGILTANGRVAELEEQGRLDLIVEQLRTKGLWPDDKAT